MSYKIENIHSIEYALKNTKRNPIKLYLKNDQYIDTYIPIIRSKETYLLTNEIYVMTDINDIIEKYNRIILLDGLQNPQNIGSIIRTAAVFGYAVLLRNNKGCDINETVVKCAAGGVDITSICVINNLSMIIKKLKENNFWICGLLDKQQHNYIDLPTLYTYKKIVIIIGFEGTGISNLTLKLCDFTHTIIGANNFHVLNAANTAAILMYSLRK